MQQCYLKFSIDREASNAVVDGSSLFGCKIGQKRNVVHDQELSCGTVDKTLNVLERWVGGDTHNLWHAVQVRFN